MRRPIGCTANGRPVYSGRFFLYHRQMTTAPRGIYDYEKSDPTFVKDLERSHSAVAKVAEWLSRKGHPVTIRPLYIRPDVAQKNGYTDAGDLEISQRIEVKHRPRLDFTSAIDYPYQTVMISQVHTYDNARPKPYAYIILNAAQTHCIIIMTHTYKHWTTGTVTHRNRPRTLYYCPLAFCTFHDIG